MGSFIFPTTWLAAEMTVFHQKLNITRLKVIVVGDSSVGKTSLIRTFKEGSFHEEWDEGEEVETKIVDHGEEKTLFQMVELHLDKLNKLPDSALNAKAVLLLYEDEEKKTIEDIKNKWYSLVNLYFSHVPLFLVRTKADTPSDHATSLGRLLAEEIHAAIFLECSAKKKRFVNHVFSEVTTVLKKKETRKKVEDENDPSNAQSRVGCWAGMAYNSVPLIKQAFRNAKEVIRNPLAFTEEKRALEYFVPVLDFNLPPEEEEKKKKKDDEEDIQ